MGLRRLKQQSQHRQQNHIDQHEEVHPKRRGPKLRMLSLKCAASYVEGNGGYHECDHSYIAKRAEGRCDLVGLKLSAYLEHQQSDIGGKEAEDNRGSCSSARRCYAIRLRKLMGGNILLRKDQERPLASRKLNGDGQGCSSQKHRRKDSKHSHESHSPSKRPTWST